MLVLLQNEIESIQLKGESGMTFEMLRELQDFLENQDPEKLILVSTGYEHAQQSLFEKFERLESDIIFSATSSYHFENSKLSYYYWKYYPRVQQSSFHFINPDFFIGRAWAIRSLLNDISSLYNTRFEKGNQKSSKDLFHRIYVDITSGFVDVDYRIRLDHSQSIFKNDESEQMKRWIFVSKIHRFLFTQSEKQNLQTYIKSLLAWIVILFNNKGQQNPVKIFRYAKNHGREVSKDIERLMLLLKNGLPFSFSHFNDGEITFISKYVKGNHKEVWFGRRQNQYTEKLGRLLVEAFLLDKKNYFIGVPCSSCHPKLRRKANALREPSEFTISAMTLHHNLAYYPEILGLLKKRSLYFVVNPYQDLTFFSELGLEVNEERTIKVPFKNSHKLYDQLMDREFEENSVVLMMCGMLGKILIPTWFENNPTTTFLTFGSSFDDLIQKNINFKLYPKKTPFSRHLIGTRSFLFGPKKKCKQCFDLRS